MKLLEIPVKPATPALIKKLEKKGLIKPLRATPKTLKVKEGQGAVDVLYTTAPRYGTHKLICVGKGETAVALTTHPDKEDVILLNPGGFKFKPLILVLGLGTPAELKEKCKKGTLTPRDFLCLELPFNNPVLCVFTVPENVPHCEVTLPGKGRAPVFFVTEPTDLKMDMVDLPGYTLKPTI